MVTYRTEHSNQVHQLVVTVSKHYYATKEGLLKRQEKPMELALDSLEDATKNNLVLFLIRDHFSGLFYAETRLSDQSLSLVEFLFRAWSKKEDYRFCGIPEAVVLSKMVKVVFQNIEEKLKELEVGTIEATSGFQNGVRDIRTVEDYLKTSIGKPVNEIQKDLDWICQVFAKEKARNGKESKLELWEGHKGKLEVPNQLWLEAEA